MARVLHQPATAAPTVVVTVAPVADQLTLATISPTVSATTNAVAATITAYAWTVSGPATIADDTTATPTITPTGGGVIGITCAATVGGIVYRSAVETLTVGDADGRIQVHHADWTAAGSAVDFNSTATKLVDGVTYTAVKLGTVTTFAATEGVGLTVDPNSDDCYLTIPGDAAGIGLQDDVVYYFAVGANIDSDGDAAMILYQNAAASAYCTAEARRVGGVQYVASERSGVAISDVATSGGGQVRILALQRQGYQYRVYYSTTAYNPATGFPALSAMTLRAKAPSGWMTLDDQTPAETGDTLAPATDLVRFPQVRVASTGALVFAATEIRKAA